MVYPLTSYDLISIAKPYVTQLKDQENPKESYLIAAKGTISYLSQPWYLVLFAKKASLADKVAIFSAETEDIAAAGCCANILWT
ncbi:hypothetical protein Tco_0972074 [Tanacetum coccineum]